MKNEDLETITKDELKSKALNAIREGNAEDFVEEITSYFDTLANEVRAEYESAIASNDKEILSKYKENNRR